MRLSVPKTPSIGFAIAGESEHDCWMFAIAFLFVRALCDYFKSRQRLEAEILVLRHQLNVLQLRAPRRLCLTWVDRALFVWLYRDFPRILDAIMILRPETIVRWHCKGSAAFWRWKSRSLGGQPQPTPRQSACEFLLSHITSDCVPVSNASASRLHNFKSAFFNCRDS
jgi:hypothetical protein